MHLARKKYVKLKNTVFCERYSGQIIFFFSHLVCKFTDTPTHITTLLEY